MVNIEVVDDAFWLKYAKDHVTQAISARDQAASKLDAYLTVVWGLYTTAFTLGTAFNLIIGSIPVIIILAIPVVIIPVARFFCTWVQLPVFVQFYPTRPDSVKYNLYAAVMKTKSRRLTWAIAASIICGASIGLSLFLFKISGAFGHNYSIKISPMTDIKRAGIEAHIPPNKSSSITITGVDSLNKGLSFAVKNCKSDNEGRLDTLIGIGGMKKDCKVFISWLDDKKPTIISSQ